MDGWNEDKLYDILSTLDDIYDLQYELRSCVRGCYTGAHTYEELQDYILRLADRLHCEAECMDTTEDEEED